jgi:hypothetical protein
MSTRTRQVELIRQTLRNCANGAALDPLDVDEIRRNLPPKRAHQLLDVAAVLLDKAEADPPSSWGEGNRRADALAAKIVDQIDAEAEAGKLPAADAEEIADRARRETYEVVGIGPVIDGAQSVDVRYHPGEAVVHEGTSRPWGG